MRANIHLQYFISTYATTLQHSSCVRKKLRHLRHIHAEILYAIDLHWLQQISKRNHPDIFRIEAKIRRLCSFAAAVHHRVSSQESRVGRQQYLTGDTTPSPTSTTADHRIEKQRPSVYLRDAACVQHEGRPRWGGDRRFMAWTRTRGGWRQRRPHARGHVCSGLPRRRA